MRQKKKSDEGKPSQAEPPENCVKCSKLQNGGHCSFDQPEPPTKSTGLGSLKSVLKRSPSQKKSPKDKVTQKEVKKQKNRVTFDESHNKYFDADYVILIHEEEYDFDDYYDEGSPYDDEDDDIYDDNTSGHNVCCSNPNCNNLISVSYPYASAPAYLPKDHQRYDFAAHYYDPKPVEYDNCEHCDMYDVEVAPDYSDSVTLSPPEGYKDGGCCPHHGLQFHPQPHASAMGGPTYQEDHGTSRVEPPPAALVNGLDRQEAPKDMEIQTVTADEAEETNDAPTEIKQRFIVETITMTTVTERRIVREAEDVTIEKSGILKGGKFWKNTAEKPTERSVNYNEVVDYKENEQEPDFEIEEISTSFVQDDEGNGNESSAGETEQEEEPIVSLPNEDENFEEVKKESSESVSPESTELMLTFKLGQHVLVANSLKPNSAVRQLFPTRKFLSPPPQDEDDEEPVDNEKSVPPKQFLVTAESLRLFEEAKNSKMLGNINEKDASQKFIAIMPPTQNEDDVLLKRTIQKNTLRRSLIRYPCDFQRKRMEKKKNENSLEERIRQLTCDIDDDYNKDEETEMPPRTDPPGEEAIQQKEDDKPARPTESSSPSDNSSSSSAGSTYKKITDVFARHSFPPPIREDVNCNIKSDLVATHEKTLPDNYTHYNAPKPTARISVSADSRKQFLSTLGPLTACVGGDGKEYSLEDIDSVLKTDAPKIGAQPDVIAGTPQGETASDDQLALFVQRDAGRIEKIRKRYSIDDKSDDEDDYGFNKRPQVKGIKPRFGTTEEIVQEIQENQPGWPQYSQGNIANPYGTTPRPTYLNRSPSVYSSNSSLYQGQPVRAAGAPFPDMQNFHFRHAPQSPPPARHRMNTPQPSPNPEAETRPVVRPADRPRNPESMYYRRTVPNVHNPCVQMQFSPVGYTVPAASIRFATTCTPRPVVDESKVIIEPHYSTLPRPQIIRVGQGQQMIRVPVPYGPGAPLQVHLMTRRCDSPQRPNSPQYLIAKGTQTAHHLPDGAPAEFVKIDFEAQGKAIADELQARQKLSRSLSQEGSHQVPRPLPRPHSPTCGRGVPEGAASCPTHDSHIADPISGNTIYYSMNV